MSELEIALSRLRGVKKIAGGWMSTCPCHNDLHQSLSIKEDNGKLLLYCHAGCAFTDIVKALGLHRVTEVTNVTPVITDTYDYISIEGLPYQVVRYQPKSFKHRRPDGKGDWIWNMNGLTPSLYHLSEVIKAITDNQIVFIVEGEKDVNNLRKVGQVATTISGGASTKWGPSLVPLFQGAKVVIIPDNDEAGRKYALYVANLLYGWCASLKLLMLPAKDVSDYLTTKTIDNLLNVVHNTKEYIPIGAPTWEYVNELRGFCIYLWQTILKQKRKDDYLYW